MLFLNLLLQVSPVKDTIANTTTTADLNAGVTENISYLDFLLKGGVMIIPIILLLFFCVYVIIDRYLSIKKAKTQDPNFLTDVHLHLNPEN